MPFLFPFIAALALTAPVEPNAPKELAAVEVVAVRNPQVFDIKKGVDIRTRFESIALAEREAVRLAFYLVNKAKQPFADASNIELSLYNGDDYVDVPLLAHDRIDLPNVPANQVATSTLFSNQPHNAIEIVYKIDLTSDTENSLSIMRARRAVAQARTAWKTVLPGIAKATVPKFNCVELQFVGTGQASLKATSNQSTSLGSGDKIKIPLNTLANESVITWSGDLYRIAACKD